MCSDLTIHPQQIILAYSYRFKIEVSFKMLKHVIGSFGFLDKSVAEAITF